MVVSPGQKEILRVLPFLEGSLASHGFEDFNDEAIGFFGASFLVSGVAFGGVDAGGVVEWPLTGGTSGF